MEKTKKREIGDLGEDIASKYLEKRGYIVLDRNYLKPWGELDIVARKDKKLHFIEVKTVRRESGQVSREAGGDVTRGTVRPEENMHKKKVMRLHRALQTYMMEKKVGGEVEWQIDLACVYLDFSSRRATVELFENIIL
ncbi:MAG: YraN family protein [Candidatus Adlerbacteria bacterium]|nr:YraN family protein [Candidatus Adlerbacteria bacterium]